jgi:hypothetical protein
MSWHKNIIHALWADKITPKRSITTSHFHIVYGTKEIFPTTLGLPVMRLLQEKDAETDATRRRKDELISVEKTREKYFDNTQLHQDNIKEYFDRHTKVDNFKPEDLVLKWDSRNEDKRKHGKFDQLWLGPFKIASYHGSNAYILQEINGDVIVGGFLNGRFLKQYIV